MRSNTASESNLNHWFIIDLKILVKRHEPLDMSFWILCPPRSRSKLLILFRRPITSMGSNFSTGLLVDIQKFKNSRDHWCMFELTGYHVILHHSNFVPFFFFFQIVGSKFMIWTVVSLYEVKHGQWIKFELLIHYGSGDIHEKWKPLNLHIWSFVGPLIEIQTVDPIWKTKKRLGVKF